MHFPSWAGIHGPPVVEVVVSIWAQHERIFSFFSQTSGGRRGRSPRSPVAMATAAAAAGLLLPDRCRAPAMPLRCSTAMPGLPWWEGWRFPSLWGGALRVFGEMLQWLVPGGGERGRRGARGDGHICQAPDGVTPQWVRSAMPRSLHAHGSAAFEMVNCFAFSYSSILP